MSYAYSKVTDLEKTFLVGNHQCVALVRHYTGAPATSAWKQGEAVLGNRLLRKGTAIATFINGKYANHQQGNHAAL
ncbi:BPSL0067 family protein [Janthinobacterium rivuli]|uniref:BPSL0067 family protein n=1 Tax=Janthinobacterium rivuli TaxID=2751478 RepID=UPI00383A9E10